MNRNTIGAVGDLISGVGVIATLGYLALQIQQNTRTLHRHESNTTMLQRSAWRRSVMASRTWRASSSGEPQLGCHFRLRSGFART
jgi:hypothetical protein